MVAGDHDVLEDRHGQLGRAHVDESALSKLRHQPAGLGIGAINLLRGR
jgi:hypothetical protein